MQLVRASVLDWEGYPGGGPRGGGLSYKTLLAGREGTNDNYLWVIAKGDGGRYSPRHRHNFDQVRFALEGDVSIGTKKVVREGEIGYFPEGTYYGPQDDAGRQRTTLVLQFAGASGQGYLSRREAAQGMEELKAFGRFEKGIFYRSAGAGKKNQDAFEAVWEHVRGRKLDYPKHRYGEPIIFDPKGFAWKPTQQPGVSRKLYGTFTERETRLEGYQIAAGAECVFATEPTVGLYFVIAGSGSCNGQEYDAQTALEIAPGEKLALAATEATEILRIAIPSYA